MKSVLYILAILTIASVAVSAADSLNGKWKGEIAAGPCGGFGAPGGGLPGGGFPGGGGRGPGLNLLEAGQRGGGFPGGPGGGFPGGPDGGGFPSTGRSGGTQKVALNIKAKEDKKTSEVKLTGNITIGGNTEDVRDGKVDGSRISFSTGKKPPVCQYAGELNAETNELRMTRTIAGSTAQGIQFTLRR
jgi:hypothetical protein